MPTAPYGDETEYNSSREEKIKCNGDEVSEEYVK